MRPTEPQLEVFSVWIPELLAREEAGDFDGIEAEAIDDLPLFDTEPGRELDELTLGVDEDGTAGGGADDLAVEFAAVGEVRVAAEFELMGKREILELPDGGSGGEVAAMEAEEVFHLFRSAPRDGAEDAEVTAHLSEGSAGLGFKGTEGCDGDDLDGPEFWGGLPLCDDDLFELVVVEWGGGGRHGG